MILLASNSPRRRELLQGLGVPFRVVQAKEDIDESYPDDMPAPGVAEYLAQKKGTAFAAAARGDLSMTTLGADEAAEVLATPVTVITADTVVVCDNEVMGKPHDVADAVRMLRKLSGSTHQVYTGVCITTSDSVRHFSVCTDVTFKELSDTEINHYIETYKPFDKAGAYGIQEWIGYIGITSIHGSYYNVMGFPVQRIYEELKADNAEK